jgi:hypothetical protein
MEPSKQSRQGQKQWQEHIALQQESGLSIAAYCQEFKLGPSNFYAWRKRLSYSESGASPADSFIQLKPKDMHPKTLRIITPAGYRLEIETNTHIPYIRRVLSLLHA